MAAQFDEYAYLEQQVGQGQPPPSGGQDPPRHRDDRRHERSRERSRSRDRRHRDDRRDRRRSRSRERSRDRYGDRRHSHKPRERTPPEVRELREQEKELQRLDRDTRTVFAYNLSLKADERDLFDFFSEAGTVVDIRIICDRHTKRSKGFAYIEYEDRNDIIKAIALSGKQCLGQTVMVKMSEAEKNLAWEAAQQNNKPELEEGTTSRVNISNLLPELAESDITPIFAPFGAIVNVALVRNATGRSLGYGHVEYANRDDALRAVAELHGMELGGLVMRCKMSTVETANRAKGVKLAEVAAAAAQQAIAMGGNLSAALANVGVPMGATAGLSTDVADGFHLGAAGRTALMERLARGAEGINVPQPVLPGAVPAAVPGAPDPSLAHEQGVLGPASPIPTTCLLLKNMFNPAEESEPTWDVDIGEDVKAECSKFGQVQHVFVDKNSKGFVYLKFGTQHASTAAQQALNGRWFAGRRIVAEFQFAPIYAQHFGV